LEQCAAARRRTKQAEKYLLSIGLRVTRLARTKRSAKTHYCLSCCDVNESVVCLVMMSTKIRGHFYFPRRGLPAKREFRAQNKCRCLSGRARLSGCSSATLSLTHTETGRPTDTHTHTHTHRSVHTQIVLCDTPERKELSS
jgi:hypothetical protein